MEIRLISDWLLVRPLGAPADVSGIINPFGRHAADPVLATVLAAGPGYTYPQGGRHQMPCEVDDVVMLQFNAGTEVRIKGESLRMVQARDLFGVLVRHE